MAIIIKINGVAAGETEYFNGSEKVSLESTENEIIFFTTDGSVPESSERGTTEKYESEFGIRIKDFPEKIDSETGMFNSHDPLVFDLRCRTANESASCELKFVYPVESDPPCGTFIDNNDPNQDIRLINPMGEDYRILYSTDKKATWEEWPEGKVIKPEPDESGVFELFMHVKLQKKNDAKVESMTSVAGYVIKPQRNID